MQGLLTHHLECIGSPYHADWGRRSQDTILNANAHMYYAEGILLEESRKY